MSTYPLEAAPLEDSATSFGGTPREGDKEVKFVPVGHISLDTSASLDPDTYRIFSFYVSEALRGSGVGRAAMEALERIATSPPISAKTLVLTTLAKSNLKDLEKFAALERPVPKVGFCAPFPLSTHQQPNLSFPIFFGREWRSLA